MAESHAALATRMASDDRAGASGGFLSRIFRPGIRLLHKLALIGALSVFPVILVGWGFFHTALQSAAIAEQERSGLGYLKLLWPAYEAALRERYNPSLYQGVFASETAARDPILGTAEQRTALLTQAAVGPAEAVASGRDFIARVADNSRLSVDPDVSTLKAINILTELLPDLGAAAFERSALGPRSRPVDRAISLARFRHAVDILTANLAATDALNFDAARSERLGLTQSALTSTTAAMIEFDATLSERIGLGSTALNPSTASQGESSAIALEQRGGAPMQALQGDFIPALSNFWNAAADAVDELLARRGDAKRSEIAFDAIIMLAVMLLVGSLIVLISGSITRRLAMLGHAMENLRKGELEIDIPFVGSGDEVGAMARALAVLRDGLIEKRATDQAIALQHQTLRDQRKALEIQNRRFDAALTNMSQGLAMFDREGALIICNKRFSEIYGIPEDALAPGIRQHAILASWAAGEADADKAKEIFEHFAAAAQGQAPDFRIVLSGGRTLAISHRRMEDGGWVSTHDDITERERAEARIAQMADYDELTLLPNRALFGQRLEQALRLRGESGPVAVLCLDLDDFKSVNDSLGHPSGDALLRILGERLSNNLRSSATLARLSGDQFAIVEAQPRNAGEITALAKRLIEIVAEPCMLGENRVVISTSIGIAVAPADGTNSGELLKCAEIALYRAKTQGRGTHYFFQSGMDSELRERRLLELDLRGAWAERQLEIAYQPIVELATGSVTGFEALLRWNHPERGWISPAEFIPIAEKIGLILPIGEWVIDQACREAMNWPQEIKVAVNLSPVQFKQSAVFHAVHAALDASGLAPSRLELEITESVFLESDEATVSKLHRLRRRGISIALDDFGTGYSSLSYLRNFPFDKIKIDQSFTRGLLSPGAADRDGSLAIVRAVTGLARGLGVITTAEGVESGAQIEILRAEGCTQAQGYYYSQARPGSEVPAMLALVNRKIAVAA